MGLLLFLGMMTTFAYGGYSVKKEVESTICDKTVAPSMNKEENKERIRKNFTSICKRSGIELSKDNNPIDVTQAHKAIEYLQYQGFNYDDVDFFKEYFVQRYNQGIENNKTYIREKHKKLLHKLKTQPKMTLLIFQREYYGNENAKARMERIMGNPLWSEMVEHYTYIRGHGVASYTEVWTLSVPNDMFKTDILDKEKHQIYKEVCFIENIDDGKF